MRGCGVPPVCACPGHRIGDEFGDGDARIDDAIDKRRVGAVLEQPAHEVREQRLVRTDRRIDAAGAVELVGADYLVIDALTHAVQALEFVIGSAGQGVDRGNGQRVVAGELRVDGVGCGQHRPGAGEIGHVGVHLAREHRVVGQAVDLRALDFAIPIGALDQANRHAPARPSRHLDDPVDHAARALLVGLHHEPQPVPTGECRSGGELLEQVEREVKTVGLLRVDAHADVARARAPRERRHSRQQFGQHARTLQTRIARVQRGELDGNARSGVHPRARRSRADSVDGLLVGGHIALRVLGGERCFTEHVVRIAIAASLALARVGDRLGDSAPGHELLAEQAHGQVHALADERLATLAQERTSPRPPTPSRGANQPAAR